MTNTTVQTRERQSSDIYLPLQTALERHIPLTRHELVGHLEDFVRECGRDEDDLRGGREITVDVVDLFFESFVQHLVSFVEDLRQRLVSLV